MRRPLPCEAVESNHGTMTSVEQEREVLSSGTASAPLFGRSGSVRREAAVSLLWRLVLFFFHSLLQGVNGSSAEPCESFHPWSWSERTPFATPAEVHLVPAASGAPARGRRILRSRRLPGKKRRRQNRQHTHARCAHSAVSDGFGGGVLPAMNREDAPPSGLTDERCRSSSRPSQKHRW